ncbi:hypothetical protein FC697_26790 [Bacillus wiedmannii]|nr:hypothetical protein FC697_26790 [Bacillus wiedmannii]
MHISDIPLDSTLNLYHSPTGINTSSHSYKWKSLFHIHHCKKIKRERLKCHLYGQLIAIPLCSPTMFQMRQVLIMKKNEN